MSLLAPGDVGVAPAALESGGTRTPSAVRSGRRPGSATLARTAVLFLLPALALLAVLRIWPTVDILVRAFEKETPGGFATRGAFAGLANFASILASPAFWQTVGQTLYFVGLGSIGVIAVSLLLAVLLAPEFRGVGLLRVLVFVPSVVPAIGVSVIAAVALRPDGWVNGLLALGGIEGQRFFDSSTQVIPTLVAVTIWSGAGYWMIFLIAGIKDIDPALYEAASLDGAGRIRSFFSVTLPLLRRPLLFVIVANTSWLFVIYAPIQAITRGGPAGSSNLLMFDVVQKTFAEDNIARGMAELVVLLIAVSTVAWLEFRLLRNHEHP